MPRVLNTDFLPADDWRDCVNIPGVIIKTNKLQYRDDRGWLVELFRWDELPAGLSPAMAYLSYTHTDVVRGPHEHQHQTDMFVFVCGHGTLYLWDNRPGSPSYGHRMKMPIPGAQPVVAVVPPGVVHAYRNEGLHELLVFNAPDKLYAGLNKELPVDEVRHELNPDTVFKLW